MDAAIRTNAPPPPLDDDARSPSAMRAYFNAGAASPISLSGCMRFSLGDEPLVAALFTPTPTPAPSGKRGLPPCMKEPSRVACCRLNESGRPGERQSNEPSVCIPRTLGEIPIPLPPPGCCCCCGCGGWRIYEEAPHEELCALAPIEICPPPPPIMPLMLCCSRKEKEERKERRRKSKN